jgi:cell fate regulator YaaT (PSP1 superfamily)
VREAIDNSNLNQVIKPMANEIELEQNQDNPTQAEETPEKDSRENNQGTQEDSPDHYDEDQEFQNGEDDERGQTRWNEGDEIQMVRVRFPGNSRSFPFLVGKRFFSYGQKVVAMSDRGMDVGYINSFPYTVKFKKSMLPIRSISKVADNDDILAMQGDLDRQKEAERAAVKLIEELNLDMQITHVEIIQFGKKMVFYFTAPARVDFRELVKRLVGELKMRIELRQISVRDRAAALGSIGACGQATCCSTFLKNYGNVSIKMAKNQNLALIPSKINGVCGQIKCCIKYEDDVYSDKRKLLPKEGTFIHAANGDKGKVTKLHILVEQFDMITERGQIRRYAKSQYHQGKKLDKSYKFPDSFQHVVNETSNVIGLNEVESQMANSFNEGLSEEEIAIKNLESLKDGSGEESLFDSLKDSIKIEDEAPVPSQERDATQTQEESRPTAQFQSEDGDNSDQKPKRPRRNNRNKSRNKKGRGENSKTNSNNEGQKNNDRPKRNRRPRNRKNNNGGGTNQSND